MAQSGKAREAGPGFCKRSIRATGTPIQISNSSVGIARSPCDEAIHLAAQRKNGLLRCARNDGGAGNCAFTHEKGRRCFHAAARDTSSEDKTSVEQRVDVVLRGVTLVAVELRTVQ